MRKLKPKPDPPELDEYLALGHVPSCACQVCERLRKKLLPRYVRELNETK